MRGPEFKQVIEDLQAVMNTPTRGAVETLKRNWEADPCWDLETTPGFEAVQEELLAHRLKMEERWKQEYDRQLREYAARVGIENLTLAAYIRRLEERIAKLEGE